MSDNNKRLSKQEAFKAKQREEANKAHNIKELKRLAVEAEKVDSGVTKAVKSTTTLLQQQVSVSDAKAARKSIKNDQLARQAAAKAKAEQKAIKLLKKQVEETNKAIATEQAAQAKLIAKAKAEHDLTLTTKLTSIEMEEKIKQHIQKIADDKKAILDRAEIEAKKAKKVLEAKVKAEKAAAKAVELKAKEDARILAMAAQGASKTNKFVGKDSPIKEKFEDKKADHLLAVRYKKTSSIIHEVERTMRQKKVRPSAIYLAERDQLLAQAMILNITGINHSTHNDEIKKMVKKNVQDSLDAKRIEINKIDYEGGLIVKEKQISTGLERLVIDKKYKSKLARGSRKFDKLIKENELDKKLKSAKNAEKRAQKAQILANQ